MNEYIQSALAAAGNSIEIDAETGRVRVRQEAWLRSHGIDALVYLAVFARAARQTAARWLIWETAQTLGALPASIHELYIRRGHEQLPHTFTTPAMNLRALTYDVARAAFAAAIKSKVGAFIFELSRGEMLDSAQRPAEYSSVILAAAIREGYRGPVFLQGDHFQVNARNYGDSSDAELIRLRNLIRESLQAGFYNIDFDASTLVDPSHSALVEQQRRNFELSAMLCDYVRIHQPPQVIVALGAEIGEVGDADSDIHELRTFMDNLQRRMHHHPGLSKLSVRLGTSPGGLVIADGSMAASDVDFARLQELSTAARHEYGMGGAAQHGASALPQEYLPRFVAAGAIELHLATEFQNLLFEHLPVQLVTEINAWLFTHAADRRKPGDSDRQFMHKTRRLASGPFKKQLWNLSDFERAEIRRAFEEHFARLYESLGVRNTADTVANVVHPHHLHKRLQDFEAENSALLPTIST